MGKKVQELRTKAKKDLIAELEELKKELSQVRTRRSFLRGHQRSQDSLDMTTHEEVYYLWI
jgi:ribosomal protein L29